MPGSGYCDVCPENTFFYINDESGEYYCKECPSGYYSEEGSVGEGACHQRRPCDNGDLDISYSKCNDGMREVSYEWADHDHDGKLDCDPDHPDSVVREVPPSEEQECKMCTKGMMRDEHGNCQYCPFGMQQPLDYDDPAVPAKGPVECT